VGVVEAGSKEFFVVGKKFYGFTGGYIARKACEFIAEDPEMSFLDSVVFFWFKVKGVHNGNNVILILIALQFTLIITVLH